MAVITNKNNIFFVTSPRTPFKMIDEIKLLSDNFSGKDWNTKTQAEFAKRLSKCDFFEGSIESNLDFSARDRITRAPKALGFINLKPRIQLTDAGEVFINSKRPEEIFTRQLLKFQLPSPYHRDKSGRFFVKPYLEILRLISELNGLSKDEIAIFIIQLINLEFYETIKSKIVGFRELKKNIDRNRTSYKRLVASIFEGEIKEQYKNEIKQGKIKTRESQDNSLKKFIQTKITNHKDYADAAIRYLRATSLVTLSTKSYNKVIIPEHKKKETEFILSNTARKPIIFSTEQEFKNYLFDCNFPLILNDNKDELVTTITSLKTSYNKNDLKTKDIEELKDIKDKLLKISIDKIVKEQVKQLQNFDMYDDIISTFEEIENNNVVDRPLFFEWNIWRAFTMLDDGNIKGNFKFDGSGLPLFNAPGNMPDITCSYNDFDLIIEVTLSRGQKQYEIEGEPVARHLAKHKKESNKESFCIFIAESLNEATLSHFYTLHHTNISYYGGYSYIIPIELEDFKNMLKVAYEKQHVTFNASKIKKFAQVSCMAAKKSKSELEWYQSIKSLSTNWMIHD